MKKTNISQILLAFVLFATFVICSFYIIILGAKGYSNMVYNSDLNTKFRVPFSYLQTRLKEVDSYSKVDIIDLDNVECLVINDEEYYTLIYYNDHYICESIIKDLAQFKVNSGEKMISVDGFQMSKIDNHQFKYTISNESITKDVTIVVR